MSVAEAQIRNMVDTDQAFGGLTAGQKTALQKRISDLVIPDTTVFRMIVAGIVLALLSCIAIIGWSVFDDVGSESALTAAIAIATGCFGGLLGALAPQKG